VFALNGRKSIPTVIAESSSGDMLIGEEAISRADAIELELNFKWNPTKNKREWERRREKVFLFVREVMRTNVAAIPAELTGHDLAQALAGASALHRPHPWEGRAPRGHRGSY
jgi:hypothetical protein